MHRIDLTSQVIRYVAKCPGKPSVSEIAAAAMASRSTVARVFYAEMGLSLGQFIFCIQMERAGDLLRTTDLQIKEVAARCGAGSPSAFCRSFKARFGISPSLFRVYAREVYATLKRVTSRVQP